MKREFTPEHRANISKASIGSHGAKVRVNGTEYDSITEASKSIGMSYWQLYRRLKNDRYPDYERI